MAQDDKKVGYRNPPKHTQFKPGQSGNPQGRKPRFGSFEADLLEELSTEILVQDNGVARTVSKQRVIVNVLVAAAMTGNMRASAALLTIVARPSASPSEPQPEPGSSPVTDDDKNLMRRFNRRPRSHQSTAIKKSSAKEPDGEG
jgi:hypothetical protein